MFLYKADFAFEGARHYPHQKQYFQAHRGLQIPAGTAFSWAGMQLSRC